MEFLKLENLVNSFPTSSNAASSSIPVPSILCSKYEILFEFLINVINFRYYIFSSFTKHKFEKCRHFELDVFRRPYVYDNNIAR